MKPVLAAFLCLLVSIAAPAAAALSPEELDARRAAALPTIQEPERRSEAEAHYQQARAFLDARKETHKRARNFRKLATDGPTKVSQLLDEITALKRSASITPVTQRERTLDATALERLLDLSQAERTALESRLAGLELELRKLGARPTDLAAEKSTAEARLFTVRQEMSAGGANPLDAVAGAKETVREAEVLALEAALESISAEQSSLETAEELANLRRESAVLELERLSARVRALESLLGERRQAEAVLMQATVERAQAAPTNTDPTVRTLVDEASALAAELAELARLQTAASAQRAAHVEQRQRLNLEFETARQRLEVGSSSSSLGSILIDQRRRIPPSKALSRMLASNGEEMSRVALRRITLDERLIGLRAERLDAVTSTGSRGDDKDADTIKRQRAELVSALNSLIAKLDDAYASYLRTLGAVDGELQQLQQIVASFGALLDERLLWIPNTTLWTPRAMNAGWLELREMLRGATISNAMRATWAALRENALNWIVWLGTLIIASRVNGRLRELSARQREVSARWQIVSLRTVGMELLMTATAVLPAPLFCLLFADLLAAIAGAPDVLFSLAQSFQFGAAILFIALMVSRGLQPGHLLRTWFLADDAAAARLRKSWNLAAQLFVPSYCLAVGFDWVGGAVAQVGQGRLAFALAMLVLASFLAWVTGSPELFGPVRAGPNLRKLGAALRIPFCGVPLALAALSLVGYHYTSLVLSGYYLQTGGLVAMAGLLYQAMMRWLYRAETRMQLTSADARDDDAPDASLELERFDSQARMIIRNMIGWSLALSVLGVWSDVLPALGFLQAVELWHITITEEGGVSTVQAITLASLLLAAVVVVVTAIACRNIPGVIDVGILQRAGIDPGSRYAIRNLLQYAMFTVGLGIVLLTLGMRWSQIHWLVAALGVGLGFGLQEIFANFISGLILLFERPVRVGDVVTIGDMTGRVSQIRIRATTIRDFDNKEIIVPNKTFITERFVNWTLSDQVTRIVLPIGVAYGTDLEKATRILLQLAAAHPKVMKEPAPWVVFDRFGDSALLLELHVYAEELNHRVDVRHEMNAAILAAFAAEGIEIPYPQHDVHLRQVNAAPG